MARKTKLTGFSRFLIVMLFVAPLAYIGASYYNGEDGIERVKGLLNLNKENTESTITISSDGTSENESYQEMKELVDILKEEVNELKEENKELKANLYEKEQLIKELQAK